MRKPSLPPKAETIEVTDARSQMKEIVLLGDSIFDNASYTEGGPDVVSHLNRLVGPSAQATLLAQDGAMIRDVMGQLDAVPESATHLFVSMGGNDALNAISLLGQAVPSVGHALARFVQPLEHFDADYRRVLKAVQGRALPTTICTIYNGAFQPGLQRDSTTTAVRLFNDSIARHAGAAGFPVLELRSVCTEDSDYWNPIEPSDQGGAKIASAIASRL